MASSPVHRGFAVVMGIPVDGVYYDLAGAWDTPVEWKGILKGELTMTPQSELIEHRNPMTAARIGSTRFNHSREVAIVFVPGDGTVANGSATAIAASKIDIVPGTQIGLKGTDVLITSSDTTFDANEIYEVVSANRVSSTTAETVWNLTIVKFGDGLAMNGSNRIGDIIT